MDEELQDIERELPKEGGEDELTPENVRANMAIPDDIREAYEKAVVAGSRIMFDKQTHEQALAMLTSDGKPTPERLGRAIAGLVMEVFKMSRNSLPPQVLVPTGVDLLVQAADFLRKGGIMKLSQEDIGKALLEMIGALAKYAGIDPVALFNQLGATDEESSEPAAPEAQGQAQPSPQPAAAGLIAQEMQQ